MGNSRTSGIVLAWLWLLMALPLAGCVSNEVIPNVPHVDGVATIADYETGIYRRPLFPFEPMNLASRLDKYGNERIVDNLVLVVDASETMREEWRGLTRFEYAQEIIRRIASTLPDTNRDMQLVVVVHHGTPDPKGWRSPPVARIGPVSYSEAALIDTLHRIEMIPDMVGPVAPSLQRAAATLDELPGNTAIVLLTRWEQVDPVSLLLVERLREQYPERLCIHAVGVGNRYSSSHLIRPDVCGQIVAADSIAHGPDMGLFVEKLFYSGPADADADGIYDYRDQCPDTLPGTRVDWDGCKSTLLSDRQ